MPDCASPTAELLLALYSSALVESARLSFNQERSRLISPERVIQSIRDGHAPDEIDHKLVGATAQLLQKRGAIVDAALGIALVRLGMHVQVAAPEQIDAKRGAPSGSHVDSFPAIDYAKVFAYAAGEVENGSLSSDPAWSEKRKKKKKKQLITWREALQQSLAALAVQFDAIARDVELTLPPADVEALSQADADAISTLAQKHFRASPHIRPFLGPATDAGGEATLTTWSGKLDELRQLGARFQEELLALSRPTSV